VDDQRLTEILDRDAIRDVLTGYLDAVRRRDWVDVLSCFVSGAYADYGFDAERTIEVQVGLLKKGIDRFRASTLLGSNCIITLRGDTASSEMMALTAHEAFETSGERTRISTVRYEDEWVRGSHREWRITRRCLDTVWKAWLDTRFDDRAGDHRYADEW
jgi:hypothetical protein